MMMLCLTISLSHVAQSILTQPHRGLLLWIPFIISIESIYATRISIFLDTNSKWIFRLSEWVVISFVIKLLLYVFHAGEIYWKDFFITNPFDLEYILLLGITAFAWWTSSSIAKKIDRLHNTEDGISWEQLGKFHKDFQLTHKLLSQQIIFIGGLIVTFTIIRTLSLSLITSKLATSEFENKTLIINVLVYFALALILLSQSQLASLRTRWWLDKLPITSKLGGRWLISAFGFFTTVALLSFILPTQYTLNLLEILNYIIRFIVVAINFLFSIILLPFMILVSLLTKSGQAPQEVIPANPIPIPSIPGTQPQNSLPPWFEFLKSLVFWAGLFGIIVFAFWNFIRSNYELWTRISQLPLFAKLSELWQGIWTWMTGINKQATKNIRRAWEQLRSQDPLLNRRREKTRTINFLDLPPRQQIIQLYLEFIRHCKLKGFRRKISHTPYQYDRYLSSELPEITDYMNYITRAFVLARYSLHNISKNLVARTETERDKILQVVDNKQKNN